jgi:uncharacterized protein (TIGR03086 family)
MGNDLLGLYRQVTGWTGQRVAGVQDLEAATPCDDWTVRDLLNHMLDTQHYFVAAARGEDAQPPSPTPPDVLTGNPAADMSRAQSDVISCFSEAGVIEQTGPALGIAFADQLLHGWDLARATEQDALMPDGLAQAAYDIIHGRFTEEQRKGVFKPEVSVPDDATPQQRLLAYTGRQPD